MPPRRSTHNPRIPLRASLGDRFAGKSPPKRHTRPPRFNSDRQASTEILVRQLRNRAVHLAVTLGEPIPKSFTCDECPCAPKCPDSFDLMNVGGYCEAIKAGPKESRNCK